MGEKSTNDVHLHYKEDGSGDADRVVVEQEDDFSKERPQWDNKAEFLLSCVGFAVGLGNVWRFPYLCYKNGGGAFLIPYIICMVFAGIPLFFLEVSLGQFMSRGGILCWKICPIFQGIGFATTLIMSFCNMYYIIILTWAFYYMFMGFTSVLPWSHCNNDWNTDNCTTNFTNVDENSSLVAPVVEFWNNKALGITDDITNAGGMRWELVGCLALSWVVVYFCIFKGVKSTGKVVYFTATFPYVMITILLIRGALLPGAIDGIKFYIIPEWHRLLDGQVWIDAGTQIFFSYAVGLGALTALGSYNKFNNNCYRDGIIISIINSCTSLYAGFAIFSIIGFMAHEQGTEVGKVVDSGPGLAFIAYPRAVSLMPVAPLWSFFFFFMIVLLGLDSQFVGVEGVVTAIGDLIPHIIYKGYNREIFIAIVCFLSFLVGLAMVTEGGMYVFQIFDFYSASGLVLLCMAFFETVVIAWVYGGKRFIDNIELMIGYRPAGSWWMLLCWHFLTPAISVAIWLFFCVTWKPMTYGSYNFPIWAEGIGWAFLIASSSMIPLVFIIKLLMARGSFLERWRVLTTPQLKPHQLRKTYADSAIVLSGYQGSEMGTQTPAEMDDSPPPYPGRKHVDTIEDPAASKPLIKPEPTAV
ncbi:sodium- and chloride-dependent GABA transporter 2-like isoform X2 [Ptychodera flava]|uniref:sodium- and chloride-dependent GABA transporter 2-like isoform X2 n=1 Tax=Ptychodera flava TaxID=63121 RepID=UPI003969E2EC